MIIPDPLAIAASVTFLPPMFNWIPACFSTVSVVIIAIDAFLAPSIPLDKLPTN